MTSLSMFRDGVPPYAYVQLPRLMTQQKYDISADLTMPANDDALALGNFMTSLTLSTLSNKTLAHIRRPVRQSLFNLYSFSYSFRKTIALPPKSWFFLGKPSQVNIKVPLLQSFITTTPNVAASVEIGRRDSWSTLGPGYGREVSIVSASLQGLAVPHGVR